MNITIIGCGAVGSQIAFGCLLHPYLRKDLTLKLLDIDEKRLEGEYEDLIQAAEMLKGETSISIETKIPPSHVYVIAAGKTSSNREEVFEENSKIVRECMEQIASNYHCQTSMVLMVSNPSHKLAQIALEYVPVVIPTGNILDNARLNQCYATGKHESPNIQGEYLKVKNFKGFSAFAPAVEALERIYQWKKAINR
jgi:malate/lactate dehydrogenase